MTLYFNITCVVPNGAATPVHRQQDCRRYPVHRNRTVRPVFPRGRQCGTREKRVSTGVRVIRGFAGAVVVWFGVTALSAAPQAGRKLDVTARDQSDLAIPGVRVELTAPDFPLRNAQTSEDGHAQFFDLQPAKYRISLSLKGFD